MASIMEQLGIYGWEEIEGTIICLLATRQPILFVGEHGTCKTEGSQRIARSLLGEELQWGSYELKNTQMDELMGYLNPKELAEGRIDYVKTPLSIWNKNAVLLDELLMCSPFMQGKWYEIVRTRKLLGLDTRLKYVFSATNPPGPYYDVSFGTIPLIDRFVAVNVPKVTGEALKRVLSDTTDEDEIRNSNVMKVTVSRVRSAMKKYPAEDLNLIAAFAQQVASDLNDPQVGLKVSPRKTKALTQFILATEALKKISPTTKITADTVVTAIMGMIPETTGLCRIKPKDPNVVRTRIAQAYSSMQLRDPLMTFGADLVKLAEAQIDDKLAWQEKIVDLIGKTTDGDALAAALQVIYKLKKNGSSEAAEVYKVLRSRAAFYAQMEGRFSLEGLATQIKRMERGRN